MIFILVALLILTSIIISIPSVQKAVVGRVTSSLSEELDAEVSVGGVHVSWNGEIRLYNVLMNDRAGDTMFYVGSLEARALSYSSSKQKVVFGPVVIERPKVRFHQGEDDSVMNFQFLSDLSSRGGGGVWNILFKQLELKDGSFEYKMDGFTPPTDRKFDENDFAFYNINGSFKDFYLIGDSLDFKIKELTTVEKNGLNLDRLVSRTKIHSLGMEFDDMQLRTEHSLIERYLRFDYNSYQSFQHFLDSVDMTVDLDEAVVDVRDLEYFSFNLSDYAHNNVVVSAKSSGPVSRLKIRDLDLQAGKQTKLKGRMDIKGLPDWQSSFVDIRVKHLHSSPQDVRQILNLELNEKLNKFQEIDFKGHLTGFYTDFAADGSLKSALGELDSRINFKLLQDSVAHYTGTLNAKDFDAGQFLGEPSIGVTTFQFNLEEGSGLTFENLETRFKSHIDYIGYNGVLIRDINANGLFTDNRFDGQAWLNDSNIDFSFDGKIDFSKRLPKYDFYADVRKVNLKPFGLDSENTRVSVKIDIDMVGDDVDNIVGEAHVKDLYVKRDGDVLELDTLEVISEVGDSTRRIALLSDYIKGELDGRYSLKDLELVSDHFVSVLFPDFYDKVELPSPINANLRLEITENDLVEYWTGYPMKFGNGLIKVAYNSYEESLNSFTAFDEVSYQDYRFKSNSAVVRKQPHQLLNMSVDVFELYDGDKHMTSDLVLNTSILPNYVEFMFDFADIENIMALRSFGNLRFNQDSIQFQLEESALYLDGERWVIEDNNRGIWKNGKLDLKNLVIQNGDQRLAIRGLIGEEKEDRAVVQTENLDLASFNPLLSNFDVQLGGVANQSIEVIQALSRPVVRGDLKIARLAINGDTLGNFQINTQATDNPLKMFVTAEVQEGLFQNVTAEGWFDLTTPEGRLDMEIRATNAAVKPIEAIFEGVASKFEGSVDGRLSLNGSLDKPRFKGVVTAKDVGFTVDYLNTRYYINDAIGISNTSLDFRGLKVRDKFKNTAEVVGQIKHDMFEDMVLNVKVRDAKNIMVLNTTKKDNEIFYGTGFATGQASFVGPIDDLLIDIKGSTNPGSKLTIPVVDDTDNSMVDYITFKKPVDDSEEVEEEQETSKEKMRMKFDFTLTEVAEFVLLFDEVLDDKITGSGVGNIKMEYATGEDFYMYGRFEIKQGIYPFSSPTLVSEKFELKPGGAVVWNGDPYNARLDIQAAVARNRANPKDLLMGAVEATELERYNTQVKTNVLLNVSGELFSPNLTFDWEFPDATGTGLSEFTTMVKKIERDQDEMNRQIFSLLTFGSFTPAANFGLVDFGEGANPNDYRDIVSSSVGTFLSNQVNNWISEYDKNLELGVDYKTRSGITDQERAELILSARRKIMNERLELAVEYNANSSAVKDPYKVDLVWRLNKEGNLKLKAYQKRANDPTLGDVSNVTTTGLGFYFRKQFDRIRLRKKKVDVEENSTNP